MATFHNKKKNFEEEMQIESDRRNPISSYYGQLETPTDFIESDRRNPISSFYGRLKTPTNSIKHRFY